MNFALAFSFIVTHASLFALVVYLSYRSIRLFSLLGGSSQPSQVIVVGTNARKDRINKETKAFICSDRDVIKYIQQDQWLKASNELLGEEGNIEMNDKDLAFYQENFGAIQVQIVEKNKKNASSLVYYRIPKSGNDVIRSLLYEYAFAATDESDKFILNHCLVEPCAHALVELLPSKRLRSILSHETTSKRYSFTFVREPILRFIAAISEIEGKAYQKQLNHAMVSTVHPLGSIVRFMELVKLVIRSGGSNALFRRFDEFDMRLIAPMIGTIQLANELEGSTNALHIFQYEELFEGVTQLSKQLGLKKLEYLATHRTIQSKHTPDPTNISHAAVSFLTLAGRDALQRFGHRHGYDRELLSLPPGQNISSLRPLARQYIRSLCRIYLVDYLCGDYDLPIDCTNLLEEVQMLLLELLQNIKCGDSFENCLEKQFQHE